MFDINQLNNVDRWEADNYQLALAEYKNALLELFGDSSEGETCLEVYPESIYWVSNLIEFGYLYIGVTIPQMTVVDIEEIMTDLFPKKVSLLSPDDADPAIPVLVAFWEYLRREYQLPEADAILGYLHEIASEFKGIINDPARFGMAKSFFAMGQASGFDMTSQEGLNEFIKVYNASLTFSNLDAPGVAGENGIPPWPDFGNWRDFDVQSSSTRWTEQRKKKQKRKSAKAARRRRRR
ncbi:MAG: hypothetical protein JW981_00325 [Anaerolineae bacterium]|nr:hypothetical protein [Anaerolineae bacterium]